jgi:hypothetical protein
LSSAIETVRSALDRLNGGAPPNQSRTIDELQKAAETAKRAADGVNQCCNSGMLLLLLWLVLIV